MDTIRTYCIETITSLHIKLKETLPLDQLRGPSHACLAKLGDMAKNRPLPLLATSIALTSLGMLASSSLSLPLELAIIPVPLNAIKRTIDVTLMGISLGTFNAILSSALCDQPANHPPAYEDDPLPHDSEISFAESELAPARPPDASAPPMEEPAINALGHDALRQLHVCARENPFETVVTALACAAIGLVSTNLGTAIFPVVPLPVFPASVVTSLAETAILQGVVAVIFTVISATSSPKDC